MRLDEKILKHLGVVCHLESPDQTWHKGEERKVDEAADKRDPGGQWLRERGPIR